MTVTSSRTIQWIVIILILTAIAGGVYHYFKPVTLLYSYVLYLTLYLTGLTGSFLFAILRVAKTTRSDPFGHGGF